MKNPAKTHFDGLVLTIRVVDGYETMTKRRRKRERTIARLVTLWETCETYNGGAMTAY